MSPVVLAPFSPTDFDSWYGDEAKAYAADKVRAGNWPAEGAVERAVKELERLLPEREATPGNLLFSALDDAQAVRVGSIWLFYKPDARFPDAYVYDLFIDERHRGKGYGGATLLAGEVELKRRGALKIGLHVFGFNVAAQNLYRKLGYEVTNLNMAKTL